MVVGGRRGDYAAGSFCSSRSDGQLPDHIEMWPRRRIPLLAAAGLGRPVGTAVRDAALRSVVFTVGAFPALTSLTLRFARG